MVWYGFLFTIFEIISWRFYLLNIDSWIVLQFRLSQGQNHLLSFGEVLFPPSSPKFAPAKLRSVSSLNRASPLLGGCPSTSQRTTPLRTVVGWGSSDGTERDERPDCPRDEWDTGKIQESQQSIKKFSVWEGLRVYLSTQTTAFQDLKVDTENYINQSLDLGNFHNFKTVNLFQTSIGI